RVVLQIWRYGAGEGFGGTPNPRPRRSRSPLGPRLGKFSDILTSSRIFGKILRKSGLDGPPRQGLELVPVVLGRCHRLAWFAPLGMADTAETRKNPHKPADVRKKYFF